MIPAVATLLEAIAGNAVRAATVYKAVASPGKAIVKISGKFATLSAGGLTKGSLKLLEKLGYSTEFATKFNASISKLKKLGKGDLIKLFKKFTSNQKAEARYTKVVAEYNELIDEEAVKRFTGGERVDELIRVIENPPTDTKSILEGIKKFNYRKSTLKASNSNRTLQGYSDHMRAQGYDELADYLDELRGSRGKLRQLVNESVRTGSIQEVLGEYYSSETGELLFESEEGVIERLNEYFTDENIQSFHNTTLENRRLTSHISARKKAEIISKVRSRTPQQVIKIKAIARRRGGRKKR
jgi:hypothetical protein